MNRVAVIGFGNIGIRHRRNLKLIFPRADLYAMSASGRSPSIEINDCDHIVNSVHALIEAQVELVIVASPAPYHAIHAIPFIEAGIPTFIEKPVTSSSEDSELLKTSIDKHLTPVAIGYCLRYLPSAKMIHQLLKDKIVGKLLNVFVQYGQYLPDWRPNKDYRESVSAKAELGGGVLLELSHEFDYIQWLVGKLKVEHVILRSTDELDIEVEDIADITLTAQSKAVVHVHLDFLQRKPHRVVSFIGSTGRLDWDLNNNKVLFSSAEGEQVLYDDPDLDKNSMYVDMLKDFVALIEGRDNNCISLSGASQVVDLIEQIKL